MLRLRPLLPPLGLFALALLVRCLGFGWGLPNAGQWASYHPDESVHQIVGAVFNVALKGELNPHFFNYPSLSVYATSAIYFAMQIAGLTKQAISPADAWLVVRDIIVAGRLFSVLCGALSAVCVWGMAREVGLKRGAILSGILMALCPGLVQHSHFATVDVPATFFVAACLWATLRAMNHPAQTKWWIWSAILAGLAAGTKYNAGLVILAPLVALALSQKSEVKPSKWLFPAAIGLAALAFFASTPYALLDFSEFWGDPKTENGFAFELLVHPREGSGDIFQGTGLGWIYHLTFNLPFVLTWPLLIAAVAGGAWATKDRRHWPLLAFGLVYFLIIGLSNVRYMRYTFFLVPPMLLWAAVVASRLPKPRIWGWVLGIFALWGTKDVLVPMAIANDPRSFDAARLKGVRDSGGRVVLSSKPWFYTPPFQPRNDNVPVEGVDVIGFDSSLIPRRGTNSAFTIDEFEWREAVRLRPNGPEAQFLKKLDATGAKRWLWKNPDPFRLPGREYVPHDYLYTQPQQRTWVFNLG